MRAPDKKALKTAAKTQKKLAKDKLKYFQTGNSSAAGSSSSPPSSPAVRFAEMVRGILYLIFAVSLAIAIVLSHGGYVITTNNIVDNLISHLAGKAILSVIAVALFIYGLKHIKVIK